MERTSFVFTVWKVPGAPVEVEQFEQKFMYVGPTAGSSPQAPITGVSFRNRVVELFATILNHNEFVLSFCSGGVV
jgi:hypothetical protein